MRSGNGKQSAPPAKMVRCAIYTRKSTDEGLNQDFNSLDAQREAAEAFILSQRQEGWQLVPDRYDDGGFSGGDMERPALKRLRAESHLTGRLFGAMHEGLRSCQYPAGRQRLGAPKSTCGAVADGEVLDQPLANETVGGVVSHETAVPSIERGCRC